MARTVRGALVQASWTGDKESMIQKHEERAHEAAKQGAQFILFQELFYGPYFCQVQDAQYYSYTELIPDGPTTKRMQDLAKQTGMVVVAPMYEEDEKASGIYYNTAAVIDSDGNYLGKYRKTHIPHVKGFWEKFYFRPGNLGYPVFETAVGKIGVYICYDRHFPEGARALGLNGAEIVLIPSATSRGLSEYLWRIEQVSHAVANGYYVGTINRVGIEADYGDDDFYGQSYFVNPRGQFVGDVGSRPRRGADHPRPRPRPDRRGPQHLAVLPRSATRRIRGPHASVVRATIPPARLSGGGRPSLFISQRGGGGHAVRIHAQARAHTRADARAHPPGGGGRLRVRLAVRQPRPVARPLSAADADGRRDRADAPRDLRHEPGDPRADGHRLRRSRRSTSCRAAGWTSASAAAIPRGASSASRRSRWPARKRRSGSSGRWSPARRSNTRARSSSSRGRAAGRCRSGSPATARWRWR